MLHQTRHDDHHQRRDHAECHDGEERRIDQSRAHFLAQLVSALKVSGQAFHDIAKLAGHFAGSRDCANERWKGVRSEAHGFRQTGALHDIGAHRVHGLLHAYGILVSGAGAKGLLDREAGFQEHRKLPDKQYPLLFTEAPAHHGNLGLLLGNRVDIDDHQVPQAQFLTGRAGAVSRDDARAAFAVRIKRDILKGGHYWPPFRQARSTSATLVSPRRT